MLDACALLKFLNRSQEPATAIPSQGYPPVALPNTSDRIEPIVVKGMYMAAKRSVVGAFLSMSLAGAVLSTAIPAIAQDTGTATGQQGTSGQQGQQTHKHSHHHHMHQGNGNGAQPNQQ